MDKKTFFENIRREANAALSKVFDKVEEVSKTSALKLKISSLKGKIKDSKTEIGEFVYNDQKKFKDYPEIVEILKKIKSMEKEIELKKEQISEIKKKEETEKAKEEETNSFTL